VNETFEDQLRTDLHAATRHTAYPSIEPADVIAEGRRVVRRRHRLQALGAAAAVAAIAVGGVLATDAGRTTTAPPAGPSTTTSATSTHTAVFNPNMPANRQFVVEVAPEGSADANVSYYEVDLTSKQRSLLGRSSTRGVGDGITWGRGDANVILGLYPKDAFGALPLFNPPATAGFDMAVEVMEGTGYQAFMLGSENAATLEAFEGLVWSMPGGGIHGPDGSLPTADFLDEKSVSTAKVFVVPGLETVGLDLLGPVATAPITEPGTFTVHTSSRTADGKTQLNVYGLVQQGSTDLHLTFSDGTTVTMPARTEPLGTTGYDAFYAEATGPEGARLLTVGWVDPSGTKQSRTAGKD
jgi:hypothetical protein